MVPYFQLSLDGCLSLGATPSISFWAQIYVFLAVIHLIDITYLSKSFNLSEKSCKMIDERPKVQRSGSNRQGLSPVPPLLLLKGTHHRSEFHREMVCFFKVGMSAILNKKGSVFGLDIRIFLKKGYIFSIFKSPPKNSTFCGMRVPFEPSKVSVLENRGLFFHGKVSGKG